jgi:hypothetical protein
MVRNVVAFVFLFIGIINVLRGKKRYFIYFLLASFTHIFTIFYLLIFFFIYLIHRFLPERRIVIQILLISLTIFFINSLNLLDTLSREIASFPIFEQYSRYLIYFVYKNRVSFVYLGKWDALLFYSSATIMFIGLIMSKKYNLLLWIGAFLYLFLVISINFSVTLTQRNVIILAPFHGIVASVILSQRNRLYLVLSYLAIVVLQMMLFVINIYSYRGYWNFSFPD